MGTNNNNMREIKFRAWEPTYREMYTFSLNDIHRGCAKEGGDPLTCVNVMQYTGLKDKNGVEIYEGDILKWRDSDEYLRVEWGCVGWVYFSTLFKGFGHPNGKTCSEINTAGYLRHSEVIGNIYENPELIQNHD